MNYNYIISDKKNTKIDTITIGDEINQTSLSDNFCGVSVEGETFSIVFLYELNATQQDLLNTVVSNHEGNELQSEIIKRGYMQRRSDGIDYYDTFRANIYLSYLNGDMSFEQVIGLESKLTKLTQKIINGDWISAKYELEALTIDDILTQQKYDEIHSYIVYYIENNY